MTANNVPDEKNRTFSHTPYMYSHGERGGPMGTYLVTASQRKNFKLWMKTSVKRIIRTGGHATGVELEAFLDGGYSGVVNLTSITGRVVVSAGAFGTPKLLMRSKLSSDALRSGSHQIGGIGPTDQLKVVQSSTDGPTMINETEWINLPVGYNLDDHLNVRLYITQ